MRIIAGRLKGRRLESPPAAGVRPTSDRLRETLFNVLDSIEGARVLDAFAGTGAVGLEALSRGAAHVTFVERDPKVIRVIRANVEHCGVAEACAIIRDEFGSTRMTSTFDVVFLDPPYDVTELDSIVAGASTLAPSGVVEHSSRRESPETAGRWRRTRVITAGDSALSFYRAAPERERESG